jgi:hypothetical protein
MSLRRRATTLVVVASLSVVGCAHRRPVLDPRDTGSTPTPPGRTVSVRAPFVDVHVQASPRRRDD